jgi:hypothetical protein
MFAVQLWLVVLWVLFVAMQRMYQECPLFVQYMIVFSMLHRSEGVSYQH